MKSNRREFLQYTGLVTAQLALTGCSYLASEKTAPKSKPNVIYILADDLGYGDLSCYGQTKFQTPCIDRLAAEGMLFTQHYSGSTVCAPSRCSLMTGLHTGHTQIRGNKNAKPEGNFPLAAGTLTLPAMFKQAGYVTGAIGKWGLGAAGNSGEPNKQGIDYFFGYQCQWRAHKYYPENLWRNGQRVELPGNNSKTQQGVYSHDLIVEEAQAFVRKNKNKPFFLYLPVTIPHAELAAPQKDIDAFQGQYPEPPFPGDEFYGRQPTPHAAFAAMITRLDTSVGQLMELLKELGLDENTVVMFSSDNGPHKEGGADPEFFDSNGPFTGYKRDLHEGGIRVPMIARWPGKIKAGSKTDLISAFWDVLPTCAELIGQKSPENIDGISFMPTLTGGGGQKQHAYLYWEFHEYGGQQAVRMGNWKAVRKDVMKNSDAPIELYDLSQDVGEANDVAARHPEMVEKMKAIFAEARVPNGNFPFFAEESAHKKTAK
jgi:arylsulfatase A-like enzyme